MRKLIIFLYFLFSIQNAYSTSFCENLFYRGQNFVQDIRDRFSSLSLKNLLKIDSSLEMQMQILKSMSISHRHDVSTLKEILKMNPQPKVQFKLAQITRLLFEENTKYLSRKNRKNLFDIWTKLSEMNPSSEVQRELASLSRAYNSLFFKFFHHAGGSRITQSKFSLKR